MKKYQKPQLVALSLSGNDALCLTCKYDVVQDSFSDLDSAIKRLLKFFDVTSASYVADKPFVTTPTCTMEIDLTQYCKFGPISEYLIFNS